MRGLFVLLGLFVCFIGSCGGGGGSDSSSDNNEINSGWITIVYTSALDGKTERDSVYILGEAFISPDWSRCCSGSAEDTGVTVIWENLTTGVNGNAYQNVRVCTFPTLYLCDHTWSASVPLVDGENEIEVTAFDPSENSGTISTLITRVPIPPYVVSTFPEESESGLATNIHITAKFNEEMNPSTVNNFTYTVQEANGNPVTGIVNYSEKNAEFIPSDFLSSETLYLAKISKEVEDLSGAQMVDDFSWEFTTGGDYWLPTSTINAPVGRSGHTAIWTGSEMIVWGGNSGATYFNTGASYNPETDSWAVISQLNAPTPRTTHSAIWTGNEMIIWGGWDETKWVNTGSRYNPSTDTWSPISIINSPPPLYKHTVIWSGEEMIVWGGYDQIKIGTGFKYNPVTDGWQNMSDILAPTPRTDHSAIWSGEEMIVWGGIDDTYEWTNTGGRYNPIGDDWQITTPTLAPEARNMHSAIWSGEEMIIWGGRSGAVGNPVLNSGGMYLPATNSWKPTSTLGAPTLSSYTSVWTGREMIVWGTRDGSSESTGARFNPSTNVWNSISTHDMPSQRNGNTAVWTGSEMIIWGGDDLNTGGRYTP